MSKLIPFPDGGYAFIKGGFPYCQGVRAQEGFAIERARFARPLPVAKGFAAIEAHLASLGRPRTALCAAELRSPKPFSMSGFVGFNEEYVAVLKEWGLFRDALNPVARSNLAPAINPPSEPSFYAFCYTVPAPDGLTEFCRRRQRGMARGREIPRRHRGVRRRIAGRVAGQGALGVGRDGDASRRARRVLAGRDRGRRSTRCTISTPSSATRSCPAPATAADSPGTTAVRRSRNWSSRWTCGAWRLSASSGVTKQNSGASHDRRGPQLYLGR